MLNLRICLPWETAPNTGLLASWRFADVKVAFSLETSDSMLFSHPAKLHGCESQSGLAVSPPLFPVSLPPSFQLHVHFIYYLSSSCISSSLFDFDFFSSSSFSLVFPFSPLSVLAFFWFISLSLSLALCLSLFIFSFSFSLYFSVYFFPFSLSLSLALVFRALHCLVDLDF